MTYALQIPCSVGFVDGDSTAAASAAAVVVEIPRNTFIIRDVPTPMMLPADAATCSHRDAAADGDSDGTHCSLVCKLRAAEVTGMGIPGKVWDAGLALAGSPPAATAAIARVDAALFPLTPFLFEEEILVRCCRFVSADGSVSEAVGWGAGASQRMRDIFEAADGSSAPITVVELGAGGLHVHLQLVVRECFVCFRNRHRGGCYGLRVR
jgi:hypothetical protein